MKLRPSTSQTSAESRHCNNIMTGQIPDNQICCYEKENDNCKFKQTRMFCINKVLPKYMESILQIYAVMIYKYTIKIDFYQSTPRNRSVPVKYNMHARLAKNVLFWLHSIASLFILLWVMYFKLRSNLIPGMETVKINCIQITLLISIKICFLCKFSNKI